MIVKGFCKYGGSGASGVIELTAFAKALRNALLHEHCLSSEIPLIEYNVCGLYGVILELGFLYQVTG